MKKCVLMFLAFLMNVNIPIYAEEKLKIAFIILEENIDKKATSVTENNLKRVFSEKGFVIVESVFKDIQIDEFIIDDNKKMESLMKNLKVEMVVIGKAFVETKEIAGNDLLLYSANISATVFTTENMKILGSSKVQADSYNDNMAAGGLEALEKASSELAEDLSKQVLQE